MTNIEAKTLLEREPVSIKAWPVIFFAGIAIHAVLWTISEPSELFSDFYKAYFPAGELIVNDGLSAAWPYKNEEASVSFVNLPLFAWLFAPFSAFGEPVGGYVFVAFGFAATLAIPFAIRSLDQSNSQCWIFTFPLFLVNGPLVNSLREGNTTHFILLLLALSLVLLTKRAFFLAGAIIGFCALIKLPLLLFGIYFFARRQWRVVTGMISIIALLSSVSILVFGLQPNLDWYLVCVEPFMGKVIPAFNVQSIDAFLMRFWTGPSLLMEWQPLPPTLSHKVIRSILLLCLVFVTALAIFQNRQRSQSNDFSKINATLFCLVLTFAVIASPLSWSHYYLLLLLPYTLYLYNYLILPADKITRFLITLSGILTSLPVISLNLTEGWVADIAARSIVSLPLFGGVLLFVALSRGLLVRQSSHG